MRRKIKVTLRRLVSNLFSGDHASNRKGIRGPEMIEVRKYYPGDDPRGVDFKISAKKPTKELFLRLKRQERAGRLIFLIDRSKSGEFGSTQSKEELQALLVDALAFAGAHEGCQIAFISFTDKLEDLHWPPQFGIDRACERAETLFKRKPKGRLTDLNIGLNFLNYHPVSCSLVFLVSDFLTPFNYAQSLKLVAFKHDFVPLIIRDRMEENLPKLRGFVSLEDLETGQMKHLNLSKISQAQDEYFHLFKNLNLDWLEFFTDETPEELAQKLRKFFEQRKRRRRRWV